jgi:hypothetical protein
MAAVLDPVMRLLAHHKLLDAFVLQMIQDLLTTTAAASAGDNPTDQGTFASFPRASGVRCRSLSF